MLHEALAQKERFERPAIQVACRNVERCPVAAKKMQKMFEMKWDTLKTETNGPPTTIIIWVRATLSG
jgi:hypothetical protein